ncbi:MAG TPA: tRNA glutamyl-Q(34) synthetase GluQRS [Polyangiales bacterium]|nr:tRNA glutamyl-Q(34) synthetase GluQRS [Polyangiales bacterium]
MISSAYRGRLAPSPTGKLHFGSARTALAAWLAARSAGGALVLRIEDLDRLRVVAGAAQAIMDDLRWLGLDWDEGPDVGGAAHPYAQSQRSAHYDAALAQLQASGQVFRCSCSRGEVLAASSAPHGELGPRYPGSCRDGPRHPDRPCALRFAMQRAEAFDDRLYGLQPAGEGDDFIVHRADGLYAYQLAVVVDDIAMGITEVVRGADLLSSTPRQLALYRALGAQPPAFLHVPLVLGADGVRLAKRHGSVAIADYRALGLSAEQLIGRLAASLGLAPDATALRAQDLIERFDPSSIAREPYYLPLTESGS